MVSGETSVYGFRVRSPYPLRFARSGGGVELLDVAPASDRPPPPGRHPRFEWTFQAGGRQVRASLTGTDGVFEFRTSDGAAWRIDPAGRTIRIANREDGHFWEPGLWGIPSLLCFMHRGDFPLHAAAVELGGGAIVLGAPGRSGKTTLALAFHRYGFRILTEDLACCRLTPSPVLLPGPALLRVRPDVYDGRPPVGTDLVCTRPDRVYLGLSEDRKGTGEPVPIRAIVILRECSSRIELKRIPASRALRSLWSLSFRLPPHFPLAQCLGRLSGLAGSVPMWSLHRPLRQTSLGPTVTRILEACAGIDTAGRSGSVGCVGVVSTP